MERKIGEVFRVGKSDLMGIKENGYDCDGCFYANCQCAREKDVRGECLGLARKDRTDVKFIKQ